MSLDFYLVSDEVSVVENGPRIFARRDGSTVEISRDEWDALHPGVEPVTFASTEDPREVFSANITHNLGEMADAAGIYECLWHPGRLRLTRAGQLVEPLQRGLVALRADRIYFERFNARNGWGMYDHFESFVERVLAACREYPDALIRVSI